MNSDRPRQSRFLEVLKYFGFSIISVVLLVVAFLVLSSNISNEIQKTTYQVLEDSTRQQRVAFQKYIDLLAARTNLIADYKADTGPNTLVESIRTELRESVRSLEIGFANQEGYLLYSDQTKISVSEEVWFSSSINGEHQVALTSQNIPDEQEDLLISAPVHSASGILGVLFVTIDGREIANVLQTLAYDGKASSVICDSNGTVLFCESGLREDLIGESVFDYAGQISVQKGSEALGLAAALKRGATIGFSYLYHDITYYAVTAPVDVLDWRIITFVSSETADVVQKQVSLYLVVMLSIIVAVGVLMAAQAYIHERITVRKLERDKELLTQSAQRYQLITRLSNEVLFHIDLQTGEISFNDSFEAMFGFPPPNCSIHRIENCLPLFAEEDQQRFVSMMNRLRAGASEAHEEIRMLNFRGILRWKRIEIFSVFDQTGQAAQLVGKIADIHRQKQSMQRLIRKADSDPLTGLLNRGAMERSITGFLSGEGLHGTHALLMMDFDNFKAVNDTLGHSKGDDLLVSFAAGIRRIFRAGDYSSRIGGDEYMVFLKNIYEDGVALEKAEALCDEMRILSKRIGVPVSVSVGVAIYSRDGESFERLYKAADEALYQVKNNGKNAVAFFSAPVHPTSERISKSITDDSYSEEEE